MNHLAPCPPSSAYGSLVINQANYPFRASWTATAILDPTIHDLEVAAAAHSPKAAGLELPARCHQDEAPDTHMNHALRQPLHPTTSPPAFTPNNWKLYTLRICRVSSAQTSPLLHTRGDYSIVHSL
ncbi:hypothetical protein IG631_08475 [Alternaria alternata]|nr:hypothetical protein IG631_08475 [Alternaria alternata]